MRILLVDDEPRILECFQALLQREDFEIEAAVCAASAIAALDSRKFDLVITDLAMESETAGYDVARAAQKQSSPPEVVLLTASDIPASQWKSEGVKHFFMKGQSTPATVVGSIKRICVQLARRRALAS